MMKWWPISSAKMKPEQAAMMSKAMARVAPKFLLHHAGGGGKRHVRRDGGQHDQINLFGGDPGAFHRDQGGFGGQIGGVFMFAGDAAFS